MKKLIGILIALVLIFTELPNTAFAGTVTSRCGSDATWQYDEATHTLTISGSGDMYDYVLSSSSDGQYHTNAPWDSLRGEVKNLNVEATINRIGNYAFYNFSQLKNLTLDIPIIGRAAFHMCDLEQVVLSSGVTAIESYAFDGCNDMKYLFLPNTLKSIEVGAFHCCEALESIILPNSLISIGDYAFNNCISLLNVIMPKSINSIGLYAFCRGDPTASIYAYSGYEGLTIYGEQGSYAETYANNKKISFYEYTGIKFSNTDNELEYPIYNSTDFADELRFWINSSEYADTFANHLESKSLNDLLEMTIDVPVMNDDSTAYSIRSQTKIKDLMAYIIFANEAQKYLNDVNAELQENFDAKKDTAYIDFLEKVKNFDVQYTAFQQKLNGKDSFNQTLQALLLAKTAMAIVDELKVTYKSGETEHIVFNKGGQTADEFIETYKEDIESTVKLSSYSYFTDIYKSTISESPEYYDDLQYYILSGGDTSYLNSYYQKTLEGYAMAIKDTKKIFEIALDPDYEVSTDVSSLVKLGIDNLSYFADAYDNEYANEVKLAKETWEYAETGAEIIKAVGNCSLLGVASVTYDIAKKYIDEVKKIYDNAANKMAGWYALTYYYYGKDGSKKLYGYIDPDTGNSQLYDDLSYGTFSYDMSNSIDRSIYRYFETHLCDYVYEPNEKFRFYLWNACNNMIKIESIDCDEYKNMMLEYILSELNFKNGETGVQFNVETSVNDTTLGSASDGGIFSSGEEVTIRANCYGNVKFGGWIDKNTGETVSQSEEYTFILTNNKKFEAQFVGGSFEVATKPVIPALSTTSYSYYAGQTANTLTVTPSGFNGSITVDWYENSSNKNYGGALVSSGNSFTLPTNIKGTSYYYFVVTNTVYSSVGTTTNKSTAYAVSQPIKVTVSSPIVTGIALSKINNSICFINREYDKSNIEVAVNYSDGTSVLTDSYFVDFDSSTVGKKTVTIRLLGFVKTFDVTVLSEDGGAFGDLSWNIDLTDGKFIISGKGDMLGQSIPWAKHNLFIKTATIENAVTSINDSAFYGCSNISEITIPLSVNRISPTAFIGCNSLIINCHYISTAKIFAIENDINYSLIRTEYDASGDGVADTGDLTSLRKHLLTNCDVSPDADCNEDSSIDILDLVVLNNYIGEVK